jgi:hypothetical protein
MTYGFYPVKRFVTPAPVPYIVTEKELPQNHRILVFLPHSDDGRYFGGTLHLLNNRNEVGIVVISPGYLGVDQNLGEEEKTEIRWKEGLRWAEVLGIGSERMANFRADRTYKTQQIDMEELDRLQKMILEVSPTMVFVPHLGDTAQAINYNSRAMVIKSLLGLVERQVQHDPFGYRPVIVVEYPTNHIPILPPSDKNFVIFFTDPKIIELRRRANLEHLSQSPACFDMTEKLVEAIHAIAEADTFQYYKNRQIAECLVGVHIDPRTSRGEHFGVTKLSVKGDPPAIVEERMEFPLAQADRLLWNRAVTAA